MTNIPHSSQTSSSLSLVPIYLPSAQVNAKAEDPCTLPAWGQKKEVTPALQTPQKPHPLPYCAHGMRFFISRGFPSHLGNEYILWQNPWGVLIRVQADHHLPPLEAQAGLPYVICPALCLTQIERSSSDLFPHPFSGLSLVATTPASDLIMSSWIPRPSFCSGKARAAFSLGRTILDIWAEFSSRPVAQHDPVPAHFLSSSHSVFSSLLVCRPVGLLSVPRTGGALCVTTRL